MVHFHPTQLPIHSVHDSLSNDLVFSVCFPEFDRGGGGDVSYLVLICQFEKSILLRLTLS